jgi:phosphatidate cytidylyltransferase
MPKREIAAFLLGPFVLAVLIFAPAWSILTVVLVAVLLAADELVKMARGAEIPSSCWLTLALVLATPIAGWWLGPQALLVVLVVAAIALPTLQLAHPRRPDGALTGAAVGLLTVVYLGLTSACLGWLRLWPGDRLGVQVIAFFLVAIWLGDSGAYYIGRNFGRHRMSPKISPKKTWEGLIASLVTTMIAAAVMKLLFFELAWGHTMALAAVIAVAGPVGDLVESQFKRDIGIKDSSGLIPGHGGLLDRTDSLFYSAPPALGYLLLVGLLP